MHPNIDTITIGATDLNRAIEFYEHGFALRVDERNGDRVSLRLSDRAALYLTQWDALAHEAGLPPASSGFRGFTLSYIVAGASDVDDMLARLVDAGGKLVKEPKFAFWGYSGHVSDPSGHLWKIASAKRRPLLGHSSERERLPKPVPAQELALTIGVGDMERAKQFYKDGLGNQAKKDYSKFVMFDGDGAPDFALYTWDALADDADVPSDGSGFRGFAMSHLVASTAHIDQLVDKAKRAGARILKRSSDGSGGQHSAYFADPDGYLWGIATRA